MADSNLLCTLHNVPTLVYTLLHILHVVIKEHVDYVHLCARNRTCAFNKQVYFIKKHIKAAQSTALHSLSRPDLPLIIRLFLALLVSSQT
jgi:hypothetical protein